jgi:tetratricopeptide (TPR) repeat protein
LAIREQALGEMHPSVAASLNDLAGFAMKGRRFDEAEKLLKRTLHIFKTDFGTPSPETAMAMHNLGDFYANQERTSEADALYRQALNIWEVAPAKYRLQLAVILNDLGNFYHSQKRLDEAKPQFDLVIALLTEEFGQDHLYVSEARAGLKALSDTHEEHNEVRDYSQRIYNELQTQITEHGRVN